MYLMVIHEFYDFHGRAECFYWEDNCTGDILEQPLYFHDIWVRELCIASWHRLYHHRCCNRCMLQLVQAYDKPFERFCIRGYHRGAAAGTGDSEGDAEVLA